MINNLIQHRCSIRLKGYDYASIGMYFITICVNNKKSIFGQIEDENMILNQLGKIVEQSWLGIPKYFQNIEDEFIIMPNHLHGVIFITDDFENRATTVGATFTVARAGASPAPTDHIDIGAAVGATFTVARAGASPAPTVGKIVGSFKSISTNQWLNHIKKNNLNLIGKFWQRNYYEHIIRNEQSLDKIRNYIFNNPGGWRFDIENPNASRSFTNQQVRNYYKKLF